VNRSPFVRPDPEAMDIETQRQEAKLRKNLEQEKAKLLERKRIDNEARQATAHKAKQKQEDEELKHLADLRSKMAHEAKEVQAKLDARFKSREQTKKTAAPSRAADVNSKPHVKQAVPAAKVKHGASRKKPTVTKTKPTLQRRIRRKKHDTSQGVTPIQKDSKSTAACDPIIASTSEEKITKVRGGNNGDSSNKGRKVVVIEDN